jgi:ribonuclease R
MRPRIGETFVGTIQSITRFGLFVGIEDPFVEGLVRLDWLSEEFFEYDEELGIVRGATSRRELMPGDPVRVVLVKADVVLGQLSFEVEGSVFDLVGSRVRASSKSTATKKRT